MGSDQGGPRLGARRKFSEGLVFTAIDPFGFPGYALS